MKNVRILKVVKTDKTYKKCERTYGNGGAAKPPLQFTLYLPLLGGAYFGEHFALKNKAKIKK